LDLENNEIVRIKKSYLISVFSITHEVLEAGNM